MPELDWVDGLKVTELRKKLKELGENTSGKKVVLVERLKTKLAEEAEEEAEEEVAEPQGDDMQGVEEEKETAVTEEPAIVAEESEAAVVMDEAAVMTEEAVIVTEEEMAVTEEEPEKKEVKGGLNELLGDGKDDLEFDFESEKPTRKKQKLDTVQSKGERSSEGDKAAEGPSHPVKTPDKKSTEDELVDFEAPQGVAHLADIGVCKTMLSIGETKDADAVLAQTTGPSRTASGTETMPLEAPAVAEEDRTCALRIQNFVRPFTEKAAKEMLSAFGTIEDMWMPPIKTHCYVVYETTEQAHDAYLGTYNVVWPRSGKKLLPQYVSAEDAKKSIEDGRSKALFARASGSASYQKNRSVPYPPAVHPTATAPPARPVSKPALELEDLFFKTQAKPPIYYLPLTDEQVAERKRSAQEKEIQSENPTGDASKDA